MKGLGERGTPQHHPTGLFAKGRTGAPCAGLPCPPPARSAPSHTPLEQAASQEAVGGAPRKRGAGIHALTHWLPSLGAFPRRWSRIDVSASVWAPPIPPSSSQLQSVGPHRTQSTGICSWQMWHWYRRKPPAPGLGAQQGSECRPKAPSSLGEGQVRFLGAGCSKKAASMHFCIT